MRADFCSRDSTGDLILGASRACLTRDCAVADKLSPAGEPLSDKEFRCGRQVVRCGRQLSPSRGALVRQGISLWPTSCPLWPTSCHPAENSLLDKGPCQTRERSSQNNLSDNDGTLLKINLFFAKVNTSTSGKTLTILAVGRRRPGVRADFCSRDFTGDRTASSVRALGLLAAARPLLAVVSGSTEAALVCESRSTLRLLVAHRRAPHHTPSKTSPWWKALTSALSTPRTLYSSVYGRGDTRSAPSRVSTR